MGGWGRFQTFLFVMIVLGINSQGILGLGLVYLELEPQLVCYFESEPTLLQSCTYEDVCESTSVVSYAIDYTSEFTLNNWVLQYDLICTPKSYIGIFGALIFTGAALGCFFMPALGDKYGRWTLYQVTFLI